MVFVSCNEDDPHVPVLEDESSEFISAVDISRYPEIAGSNPTFYDLDGNQNEFLAILKDNGINTIRLRLWVSPYNEHSGFNEVLLFSRTLKSYGFKTWLTLHYSDTWADPGHQEIPLRWQDISFTALKDSVYSYTKEVTDQLKPDYIQIGNEINSGLLHPYGHIIDSFQRFKELVTMGITAVRAGSTDAKIMLHFAGIEASDWFFDQVNGLDYDIIALSYYPLWHGKSLESLETAMQYLGKTYGKKVVIAETAYPFTLDWNDWTDNIVGLEEQLILPRYPATNDGQRQFIRQIKTITQKVENGIGFCYWGAELIAWKGNQSVDASPWENQALFDFRNMALPVLREFKME